MKVFLLVIVTISCFLYLAIREDPSSLTKVEYLSYIVDPKLQELKFFSRDGEGKKLLSFKRLAEYLVAQDQELVFAMNGGMFEMGYTPKGLYVEESQIINPIDRTTGQSGNFYLEPNGIFYLTINKGAVISKTEDYIDSSEVEYATQSGPMLLIDGAINPLFKKDSQNLNIRNGVGILPSGHLLFVMSKGMVSFYDFANYFKERGAIKALYLDGFVSRVYQPSENWTQQDGNFGVIIAEIKKQ